MERPPRLLRLGSLACTLLVLLHLTPLPGSTRPAEQLSQVKRVYVDSFGDGKDAAAMRRQIMHRLGGSHRLEVVADPARADAVIKGTGQVWITGYELLSPRSPTLRNPVYRGFLSVKVIGKNDQVLWSYLVTPSKLSWTSVPNDLANQLAGKLIAALKEPLSEEPTTAGSNTNDAQGTLQGAGSTFSAPLYQQWFQLFAERYSGVHISYDAVGSGEGIRRLQNGEIDFGASDMPLTDESMKGHQEFIQVPTVLGAVVPIYNVKGFREPLQFTPQILADIYMGRIKKWNDPLIKRSNPTADLPDAKIVTVHRSDSSGTTFVWTDYLSKTSPQWKSSIGSGAVVAWPTGIAAERSEGVAAAVQNTPDAIGYVEFIYAIQHQLSFGAVRNASGRFVRADIASVNAAAIASSTASERDLRVSITDPPGTDAYPIASYTWILLPSAHEGDSKKAVLKELVRWMLTSGQKSCSALGYVPLPATVVKRALEVLDTATPN